MQHVRIKADCFISFTGPRDISSLVSKACPVASYPSHSTNISGDIITRALLTSELEVIFARAPPAPNDVASLRVRDAYAKARGKATEAESSNNPARKLPGPEDDCAICYDGMHKVAEMDLSFCDTCGNALHKECFQQCKSTVTSLV